MGKLIKTSEIPSRVISPTSTKLLPQPETFSRTKSTPNGSQPPKPSTNLMSKSSKKLSTSHKTRPNNTWMPTTDISKMPPLVSTDHKSTLHSLTSCLLNPQAI